MEIVTCLVLALAVGSASFTVARTKISVPFRTWVMKKSKWFGGLVTCPYCTSHWLAAVAVGIYRPRPVELWAPVDWGVAWLMTVALAAFVIGLVTRSVLPPAPIPANPMPNRSPEPY